MVTAHRDRALIKIAATVTKEEEITSVKTVATDLTAKWISSTKNQHLWVQRNYAVKKHVKEITTIRRITRRTITMFWAARNRNVL